MYSVHSSLYSYMYNVHNISPCVVLFHGLASVLFINGLDECHVVHIATIRVLELGNYQLRIERYMYMFMHVHVHVRNLHIHCTGTCTY